MQQPVAHEQTGRGWCRQGLWRWRRWSASRDFAAPARSIPWHCTARRLLRFGPSSRT